MARAMVSARFPARALLVCAGNPCPCGFDGDPVRRCVCPPGRAEAYRARLSGPVLDRIDLHVEVPRLARDEVLAGGPSEPSAAVRARVGGRAAGRGGRGVRPSRTPGSAPPRRGAQPPSTRAGGRCSGGRSTAWACPRAPTTACCASAAPSPTWPGDERVAEQHLAEALGYRVAAEGAGAAA